MSQNDANEFALALTSPKKDEVKAHIKTMIGQLIDLLLEDGENLDAMVFCSVNSTKPQICISMAGETSHLARLLEITTEKLIEKGT